MADEEVEVSDEQQAILLEFQDITGMENFNESARLLSQHSWDLQIAVQDLLNRAEGRNDVYSQNPEMQLESANANEPSGAVANVVTGRSNLAVMGWPSWLVSFVSIPFQFGFSVISDVLRFIVGLVWPSLFGADTTPLEDVLKFKDSFEEQYGSGHPVFYQGSYSDAVNDAKRELRFLLVYLHSASHTDTEEFCRETLTNESFRDFVNGNMLFWAGDVSTREGYRVSYALRETGYPFLAMVCLRDNRMMVVGRLQGLQEVDQCIARLTQIMEDNEPSLVAARNEREERNFNQTLRAEQDAAYLESLRADQEKERQKTMEAETKRLEEEKKKDKQQTIENKIKAIAKKREELLCSLPPEPQSGDVNAIRIVIRLPHGERMDRFFLKTDRLQSLYDYVFCNEQSPHDFKLVSHFPRKVFEVSGDDADVTLDQVGLDTSATLYVHDLTEEDEDDD